MNQSKNIFKKVFKRIVLFTFFLLISNIVIWAQGPDLTPRKNSSGKYGYANRKGDMTISYQFDDALGFSQGYAAVKKDGYWGYINESGTVMIDYQFETAWFFTEKLAAVKKWGQWGYINKDGMYKIDSQYDDAGDFSEGLAWVKQGKKIGFIDNTGKTIISFEYNAAGSFEDGLAPVQKDGKWGYVDKNGNVKIDFQFNNAKPFNGGLAPVKSINYWGYIDKNGKLIIDYQYSEVKDDYKTSSFGWTYAASAYKLKDKENLEKALTIIENKTTYFSKDEWSKLIDYYKFTGNTEKLANAKKQKKLSSGGSSFNPKINIGGGGSKSSSIDFILATAPFKLLYNQFPIYTELRVGLVGIAFRYNKYEDFKDKYRFGAWRNKSFGFTYDAKEYSLMMKFYQSRYISSAKIGGYGNSGPYGGFEFRFRNYKIDTLRADVYNIDETLYRANTTLYNTKINTQELTFIYGYSHSKGIIYFDCHFAFGFGLKNIKYESYNFDEHLFKDNRLKKENWKGLHNFYIPARMGVRFGINIL